MANFITVNAKGLACPEPVVLTKKALLDHDKVIVIVDNTTAVENIKRLASAMNCDIVTGEEKSGEYKLKLSRSVAFNPDAVTEGLTCDVSNAGTSGPSIFVINSDSMGKGNDDLGKLLIRSFMHTVGELDNKPDAMIFYNTGVKLTVDGSEVLEDLKKLEEQGIKILVCGTCLNYFDLKDKIQAGIVSNMYDIAGLMSTAGRIVIP